MSRDQEYTPVGATGSDSLTPSPPRPLTPSSFFTASLTRLGRLVRKELRESLRDRRTVITLVLMPVLLYPLLTIAFQQFVLSNLSGDTPIGYRMCFRNRAEEQAFLSYLGIGQHLLLQEKWFAVVEAPKPGEPPVTLSPHVQRVPQFKSEYEEDPAEAVRQGRADAGLAARPGGVVAFLQPPLALDWDIFYREDSPAGLAVVRYLHQLCESADKSYLAERVRRLQRGEPLPTMQLIPAVLANPQTRKTQSLAVLVPLILILMTITGAVYPAIDLTAGERERGTLEILVAAPVSRLSLLFAKYVAVVAVAMLTALVNLGTMTVTLWVSGLGAMIFGSGLSFAALVQVFFLLLLFAAFFGAVLLVLTSFARSFKEAQAYLIPLMLLALTPGMLSLVPNITLEGPLVVAPLINIVLLARDVFEGAAQFTTATVVILSTAFYAVAALTAAARLFGAEAVLYSQSSGWTGFLRRPAEPREHASVATALLCLALLFPATFLLNGLFAQLHDWPLGSRLLLLGASNVLLFAGFPLVAAWRGRVRPVSGFLLYGANPGFWLAALLLGASLWPFIHELILAQRQIGFRTLREDQLARIQEVLKQWRDFSPVLIVLVQAVLPAVAEELFFRGYLFSALRAGGSPRVAILGSALLFGLFHLLVTDMLVIERLVPSTLLGLVLGWLCWKSGSVLPGMGLHVVHNGLLVLMAYYEPQLEAQGWTVAAQDHLPLNVLLVAGVMAALGFVLLAVCGRTSRARTGAAQQ
jgi:ABC-2 type transport system permease protein/sodium transport system permease protein